IVRASTCSSPYPKIAVTSNVIPNDIHRFLTASRATLCLIDSKVFFPTRFLPAFAAWAALTLVLIFCQCSQQSSAGSCMAA
ncbi:MAG: hypothetical protein NTX56_09540, partial [Proteobacteria bacterium]|nr:hypothetical protein [Pseudomonadota bacterium]